MKLICQKWEESERDPEFGVSVRPDGYSLHPSLLDLSRYVKKYEDGLPTDHVPDVYSRPCGDPYQCEINLDHCLHDSIKESMRHQGHFRAYAGAYPEPIDRSEPTGWVNLPEGGQARVTSPVEKYMQEGLESRLRALHPNIDKRIGVQELGQRMNRGKEVDEMRRKIIGDADDLLAGLPPPTQFPDGVNPEGMAEVEKEVDDWADRVAKREDEHGAFPGSLNRRPKFDKDTVIAHLTAQLRLALVLIGPEGASPPDADGWVTWVAQTKALLKQLGIEAPHQTSI